MKQYEHPGCPNENHAGGFCKKYANNPLETDRTKGNVEGNDKTRESSVMQDLSTSEEVSFNN